MDKFYQVVVTLANAVAVLPIVNARQHGQRLDSVILGAAALGSIAYHIAPVLFPKHTQNLLWVDRVTSIMAVVRMVYRFYAVCPRRASEAFKDNYWIIINGLVSLFASEVILKKEPSIAWCILHCIWHVSAFLTARNLQNFIY